MIYFTLPSYKKYVTGYELKQFYFHNITFPSGCEEHISLTEEQKIVINNFNPEKQIDVYFKPTQLKEVFTLCLVKNALDNFYLTKNYIINLHMPYIPYARQDRISHEGEAFSLKTFSEIINSQHFNSVYSFDVHSDVSKALFNNLIIEEDKLIECIKKVTATFTEEEYKNFVFISPDGGALKKLYNLSHEFQKDLIICNKHRDTKTGKLSNIKVDTNNLDLTNRSCLIIDDICDGGGTFNLISKALRDIGCQSNIYLFISHGLFTQGESGVQKMHENGITKIFTTNSVEKKFDSDLITYYILF